MAKREPKEEFVVTDRRKFRFDGEDVEHVQQPDQPRETAAEAAPAAAPPPPAAEPPAARHEQGPEQQELPPIPTPSAEDATAAQRAYEATAERMDDVMRAQDPAATHEGPIDFTRVIQSLYVTAIVQLGLNTPPGQQMRVDLVGARHTIDMLGVLAEKTRGNTAPEEEKLLQTALFELRMSFLEVTQLIAQNAQARAAGSAPGGGKIKL